MLRLTANFGAGNHPIGIEICKWLSAGSTTHSPRQLDVPFYTLP